MITKRHVFFLASAATVTGYDTNALPVRTELTLQDLISRLNFTNQKPVLQRVINQLLALRIRIPSDLVPLVDQYRVLLETYLQQRERAGYAPTRKGQPPISIKLLANETIQRLNALDQQRQQLRQTKLQKLGLR